MHEGHVCRGVGARRARDAGAFVAAAGAGLVVGGVAFGLIGDAINMRELETVGMIAGPVAALILLRAFRAP
jgi:hypothetical protein